MSKADPVFNEPSIAPLACDRAQARMRVARLLEVLRHAPDYELGSGLRVSEEFYGLELTAGYTFVNWLDDITTGRDERGFFLSLGAKSPFLRLHDGAAFERLEDTEVTCQRITHQAFLAAYSLDSVLVSFDHDVWSQPDLPAIVTRLDTEGEIFSEDILLINFARLEHYDYHAAKFARRNAVTGTDDLWSRRAELFPNLIFCPSVQGQLDSLGHRLPLIISRLEDLQRAASSGEPFNSAAVGSRCNPTSLETFKQYGAHYDFRDPDGVVHCCGWHLYLADVGRIYFDPLPSAYIIGHIGKHLPTVKFP